MNSFLIRYDTLSKVEQDNTTACAAFAFEPPLKAERGKSAIRLMVTILLRGNKAIDQVKLTGLGNALAVRFYNTGGPITSALKGIIDQFNTALFDDNMTTTARGSFQNGHIVVFALREDVLYIVQSGLSKVYHITQLGRAFHDEDLAGKGAGLTSAARMYFAQAQVDANDKFIVIFEPETIVEKGIESLRQISTFEMIQKRLFSLAEEPVRGALFDFQYAESPAFVQPEKIEPKTNFQDVEQSNDTLALESAPEAMPTPEEYRLEPEPEEIPQPQRKESQARQPKRRPQKQNSPNNLPDLLLRGLLGVKAGIGVLSRSLPWVVENFTSSGDEEERPQRTSRNLSIGLAILIPLALFIYANYYYGNFGYLARYNAHLDNAADELVLANNESDPAARKGHYRMAIEEIEKAKSGVPKLDERGATLLADALRPLDELEKVTRFSFSQALSQRLPTDHNISQMVVNDTEIYLLDETDNTVIREVFNGTRFDRDKNFICGKNAINTDNDPGKILTLLALPRVGSSTNTVMAIDQNANMIYCGPGKTQVVESLPLPSQGIKSITAAAIQGNTMILLDANGRAIWVYQADETLKFSEEPMFYFTDDIPQGITGAIDLVFNQDSVYLLSGSGELTVCSGSGTIVCDSPYQFIDPRLGMQSGVILEDGLFSQAEVTHLPTASVLFMDKERKAIFRFSAISMELQNKYLADPSMIDETLAANPFKAFAVNTSNQLFVLVDGQIYSAKLFK